VVLLINDIDQRLWLPLSIGVILLTAIATFIIGTGSFKRKGYAVREKDILFRTGWIIQKLHIVPFNRVQHCVVQSGPIGRKFGLASLSIYTAAANISDISIRGLKTEDAETLKGYILEQIQPLT
jgi:membrane protein YdbS with pleckstrin-like domain